MDESVWTALVEWLLTGEDGSVCRITYPCGLHPTILHRMPRHSTPCLHGKKSKTNRMSYGKEMSVNSTKPSLAHFNFSDFEKRMNGTLSNFSAIS
jgi:hypothetical protein